MKEQCRGGCSQGERHAAQGRIPELLRGSKSATNTQRAQNKGIQQAIASQTTHALVGHYKSGGTDYYTASIPYSVSEYDQEKINADVLETRVWEILKAVEPDAYAYLKATSTKIEVQAHRGWAGKQVHFSIESRSEEIENGGNRRVYELEPGQDPGVAAQDIYSRIKYNKEFNDFADKRNPNGTIRGISNDEARFRQMASSGKLTADQYIALTARADAARFGNDTSEKIDWGNALLGNQEAGGGLVWDLLAIAGSPFAVRAMLRGTPPPLQELTTLDPEGPSRPVRPEVMEAMRQAPEESANQPRNNSLPGPGGRLINEAEIGAKANCFTAGTPLLTPTGSKLIEKFKAGDLILSRSEFDPNGELEAKVVEEVFVRFGDVLHLHISGQVIRTTAEHPFWVCTKGWMPAHHLKIGDRLLSHDGQIVAVEDVFETGEREKLYNLRVADYHTYFVGCQEWGFSVWAHNSCFEVVTATDGMLEVRSPTHGVIGRFPASQEAAAKTLAARANTPLIPGASEGQTVKVFTATDGPVDFSRAGTGQVLPDGLPTSKGLGGTYTTNKNVATPEALQKHIADIMPVDSYPKYVSEVEVPATQMRIDASETRAVKPDIGWLPPNQSGAKVTRVWEVTWVDDPAVGMKISSVKEVPVGAGK